MADLIITERENLTAIAEQMRALLGVSNTLTLNNMTEGLQTTNEEKYYFLYGDYGGCFGQRMWGLSGKS